MHLDADWLLTPERIAVHLPSATAVVADLHLGYSAARRAGGEAVPLPDLGAILSPFSVIRERIGVRRLVIAGDLFEAGHAGSLLDDFLDSFAETGMELAGLVPGNHDRRLAEGMRLPLYPEGYLLGRWRVVHGDRALPAGPVVHGHFHPCLRWRGVAAPCFLATADRLVLPAFSRDASGVGVVRSRRWRGYRCLAPVGGRVLDFGQLPLVLPPLAK
jgi:putative SbcD/Mre11-related phosphoesterase